MRKKAIPLLPLLVLTLIGARRPIALMMIAVCCVLQAAAQNSAGSASPFLLFGGYSVNADYVPNRSGVLVIRDQKVSPFFSHGSGPVGFEASITRIRSKHLAFTADLSGYSDRFSGGATYCPRPGCAPGLTFEARTQAFYLVAGPEFRGGEWRRVTPFVHGLLGAVMTKSNFTMSGSNLHYFDPFSGSGLIVASRSALSNPSTVRYSDTNTDSGLTLTLGAGLDVRLSDAFAARVLMDYAPTFLVRPDLRNTNIPEAVGTTHQQGHTRLTVGVVWKFH
jgi:opacity protein-like surface antigen